MKCIVVRDSASPLELEDFFPSKTKTELEELIRRFNIPEQEKFEVNCLLIETENNKVLIDAGWGSILPIFSGNLVQNLQMAAIRPEEIDTLIISHVHPDHVGGIIDSAGKIVFLHAHYYLHKTEYQFWTSGPDLSALPDNFRREMPLAADRVLNAIQGKFELVSNHRGTINNSIEYILAPGHTPGHLVLGVSSDAGRLICFSDLFHHGLELVQPDLCTPIDLSPRELSHTRMAMLSQAVSSRSIVFSGHFPFPGLGYISEIEGEKWAWEPLKIS